MSLENLMLRITILALAIFALSGCVGKGLKTYDCMQFEEEPKWHHVAFDTESEERFKELVEAHYFNAPEESFLMNKGKKRKYFWYKSESGEVLACVVDREMWRQYHEGCFADRIIITTNNGTTTLKESESVLCT